MGVLIGKGDRSRLRLVVVSELGEGAFGNTHDVFEAREGLCMGIMYAASTTS